MHDLQNVPTQAPTSASESAPLPAAQAQSTHPHCYTGNPAPKRTNLITPKLIPIPHTCPFRAALNTESLATRPPPLSFSGFPACLRPPSSAFITPR